MDFWSMKKAQRKPSKAAKRTVTRKPVRAAAKKAVAMRSAPKPRAVPAAPSKEVSAALDSLKKRLQTLEDIMEISRLKAAYCEAVDGGWDRRTHNGEAVAALFVDDGVWDAGKIGGRGEGHDGIVRIINSFQNMPFALHRVTNPDIRINGNQATGKWHVIAYLSQPDGTPVMFMGTYRDRFVRTPQGWRFRHLGGAAATFTSLREGWGKGEHYKRMEASAPPPAPAPASEDGPKME
jgi:SnoaL-like domain